MDSTVLFLTALAVIALLFYSFVLQRRWSQHHYDRRLEELRLSLMQEIDVSSHELKSEIEAVRVNILNAQASLTKLSITSTELRRLCEHQQRFHRDTAEAVTQLQRLFSGAQSLGAFGEYLVADQLKFLPPVWIARDVIFPNKTRVEFALRTPIGKLIPIDSKWVATELLKKLDVTCDLSERTELVKKIQIETYIRAKEVLKYRDEHRTAGFCIAVVPDRAFVYSHKIQPMLAKLNIALISYSLLVPYLLVLIDFMVSNNRALRVLEAAQIIKMTWARIEEFQVHIDDALRSKFEAIKDQQSQYRYHNQEIMSLAQKIQQLQQGLLEIQESLPSRIDTLNVLDLSSTPKELHEHLGLVKESLLELPIEN